MLEDDQVKKAGVKRENFFAQRTVDEGRGTGSMECLNRQPVQHSAVLRKHRVDLRDGLRESETETRG